MGPRHFTMKSKKAFDEIYIWSTYFWLTKTYKFSLDEINKKLEVLVSQKFFFIFELGRNHTFSGPMNETV